MTATRPAHHARFLAIAYACYLGANTVPRLASEWGITSYAARGRLKQAEANGYLIVAGVHRPRGWPRRRGQHPCLRYAPAEELVREWQGSPP